MGLRKFFREHREKKEEIIDKFPALAKAEFISYCAYNGNVNELPACDAIISTLWNSCYISLKFNKTKRKFYFIQDFEPCSARPDPEILYMPT